jgi:hypothetical protein
MSTDDHSKRVERGTDCIAKIDTFIFLYTIIMKTTLHATDRNLDYGKVENALVEQTREYVADKAKANACIV